MYLLCCYEYYRAAIFCAVKRDCGDYQYDSIFWAIYWCSPRRFNLSLYGLGIGVDFAIMILVLQQFDGLILGPRLLGQSTGFKPDLGYFCNYSRRCHILACLACLLAFRLLLWLPI